MAKKGACMNFDAYAVALEKCPVADIGPDGRMSSWVDVVEPFFR